MAANGTKTRAAAEKNVEVTLELWQNSTAGRVVLERFNQQGSLVAEMIGGHRQFHISAAERRINQEKAATPEQDVFQNGICQPISLDPTEPDTEKLLANPNILNEEAQGDLFEMAPDAMVARLGQITHVQVLNRLLEVAVERDANLSQYAAIQRRLDEVAPLLATEIVSASSDADAVAGRPSRPVTPR